jgi:prepilin-type N-terminal cleavage/methylation domain-containing protein
MFFKKGSMTMFFRTKKSAFTLIELLVVIVIIGILATIGVSQFNSYQEKARDAYRLIFAQNIERVVMAEFVSAGAADNSWFINFDAAKLQAIMNKSGLSFRSSNDICPFVFWENNPEDVENPEFSVVMWGESRGTLDKDAPGLVFTGPALFRDSIENTPSCANLTKHNFSCDGNKIVGGTTYYWDSVYSCALGNATYDGLEKYAVIRPGGVIGASN